MQKHPQLTLALDTAPATTFTSFHVDENNLMVRDAVRAFVNGRLDDSQMFLWGDEGTGKSHLLSAACEQMYAAGFRTAYVPGEWVNSEGALSGLESCELLCIDDLQRLDHATEEELFHCINRCRDCSVRIILAADRSPDELGVRLPDLQTRLSWGLVYQAQHLGEDGLHTALRREIELRSLSASKEVITFILRRFPRRMATLKRVVDTLDKVSLSEQRHITIPLIKRVFSDATRVALFELGEPFDLIE